MIKRLREIITDSLFVHIIIYCGEVHFVIYANDGKFLWEYYYDKEGIIELWDKDNTPTEQQCNDRDKWIDNAYKIIEEYY